MMTMPALKLPGVDVEATEKTQTVAQYNTDLDNGHAEVECGNFITAHELKIQAGKW